MATAFRPLLLGLLWLIRVYKYLLFAWVVLTWVPAVAGSPFHNLLGLPVLPALNLFSFLNFGGIGFSAIAVLLLFTITERQLERVMAPERGDAGSFESGSTVPDIAPMSAASDRIEEGAKDMQDDFK